MKAAVRTLLYAAAVACSPVVGLAALLAGNYVAAGIAGVTFAAQLAAAWRMRPGPRRPLRIPRRAG